jgi:hypothetical protein
MDGVKQSKLSQWIEHSNAILQAHARIYRSNEGLRADETALIFQASLRTSGSFLSHFSGAFHLNRRCQHEQAMDPAAPIDLKRAKFEDCFIGSWAIALLLVPVTGVYGAVQLFKEASTDRSLCEELERLRDEISSHCTAIAEITRVSSSRWGADKHQSPFVAAGSKRLGWIELEFDSPSQVSPMAGSSTFPSAKKCIKAYNTDANGAYRIAGSDIKALDHQMIRLKRTDRTRDCLAVSLICWNLFGALSLYSAFQPLPSNRWLAYSGGGAAAATGGALLLSTWPIPAPEESDESLSHIRDETRGLWSVVGINTTDLDQFTEFGQAIVSLRVVCQYALNQGGLDFSQPVAFIWQTNDRQSTREVVDCSQLPVWEQEELKSHYSGLFHLDQ